MVVAYRHEPFTDFGVEANRLDYLNALQTVEGYLGQDYDLVMNLIVMTIFH